MNVDGLSVREAVGSHKSRWGPEKGLGSETFFKPGNWRVWREKVSDAVGTPHEKKKLTIFG